MRKFPWVASMFLVAMMFLAAGLVSGQNYPNKPIRMVTNPAGGGGDFAARIIALGVSGPLRQPMVIENRASKVMGTIVAKAAPDGYTLLVSPDSLWIAPLLEPVPYDAVRDFAPVTLLTRAPNILVVNPALAAKSVKELIALAKAKPGELNYAHGAIGGSTHLAAELFKAMAGVNMTQIIYKGSGPALTALIGGEVLVMFPNAAAGIPHVKSGKLRALAIGSTEPSALVPGLPTMAASGLPGYESASTVGVFAPGKTPKALINRLSQEIVRFVRTAEAKERFLAAGSEVVGGTPEQLAATITSETARMGKVIKDGGIRIE